MNSPANIYRKKVCHLTSVHSGRDTRILFKESMSLAAAGYDVTIVAPGPRDEHIEGVRIVAVGESRGRLRRMTSTAYRVLRASLQQKADLYHFHDPELIPAGILLRLMGKHVVYDVHEDLPRAIMMKQWVPRYARKLVGLTAECLERFAARMLTGVVAATPVIGARFPATKSVVVNNYPPQRMIASETDAQPRPSNWITYVGGMSEPRGIRQVIDAMGRLPGSCPAKLVLAGSFCPASLEHELCELPGWSRVDYRQWCTPAEVATLLRQSCLGIVTFLPEQNHIKSQPNKLFEYMAAGIPVIASDFPLWRGIVGGHACGLLVDPTDPQAIASAILELFNNRPEGRRMGARGREAVLTDYNWNCEASKLVQFYGRIAG